MLRSTASILLAVLIAGGVLVSRPAHSDKHYDLEYPTGALYEDCMSTDDVWRCHHVFEGFIGGLAAAVGGVRNMGQIACLPSGFFGAAGMKMAFVFWLDGLRGPERVKAWNSSSFRSLQQVWFNFVCPSQKDWDSIHPIITDHYFEAVRNYH